MPASLRIGWTVAALLALPLPAAAQSRTATISVVIAATARLSVSPAGISFPDSDPTGVPLVAALPGPVGITVKARAAHGATLRLTLRATDDLRSGVTTIPAGTLTWTAAGDGFASGTLTVADQTIGTWVGSGVRTGTQSFLFQNSWSHPVGTYTLSMQYTLSSP